MMRDSRYQRTEHKSQSSNSKCIEAVRAAGALIRSRKEEGCLRFLRRKSLFPPSRLPSQLQKTSSLLLSQQKPDVEKFRKQLDVLLTKSKRYASPQQRSFLPITPFSVYKTSCEQVAENENSTKKRSVQRSLPTLVTVKESQSQEKILNLTPNKIYLLSKKIFSLGINTVLDLENLCIQLKSIVNSFRQLTILQLKEFLSKATVINNSQHKIIVQKGSHKAFFFILISGFLFTVKENKTQIVLQPGQNLGYSGQLWEQTYWASKYSSLIRISIQRLGEFLVNQRSRRRRSAREFLGQLQEDCRVK